MQVVDPTGEGTATIGKEGALGADDWAETATKRENLSANAQKLFDLAMQVQMRAGRSGIVCFALVCVTAFCLMTLLLHFLRDAEQRIPEDDAALYGHGGPDFNHRKVVSAPARKR